MMQYTGKFIVGDPKETEKALQRAEELCQRERERDMRRQAGFKIFELNGDIVGKFAKACDRAGVSQTAKLRELIEQFIREQSQQ